MTRAVPIWRGKTDDTPIPPRVKARVCLEQDGRCAVCAAKFGPKVPPEFDHRIALVNGGENAEDNIQALCPLCHGTKSRRDVAQKAKDARVRQKHLGIKTARSPLPGGRKSAWKRKLDGTWVRRDTQKG